MNKLLTYAGTQPIYLGDIDFMQNAAAGMFKSLAKALMNMSSDTMNAILQGVAITYGAGIISWSAGIVVLNGEILPVAAGSISGEAGNALYFHVNSVLSGSRTFKNLEEHDCYDTRSAVLTLTSTGGVAYSSMPRLHEPNDEADYLPVDYSSAMSATSPLNSKNGLFYVEVPFTLSGITANEELEVGYVDYNVFHIKNTAFSSKTYKTSAVYVLTDGTAHIIPLAVTVSVAHDFVIPGVDRLRLELSVLPIANGLGAGSGTLIGMIPLF
jgi:hypothetical protein